MTVKVVDDNSVERVKRLFSAILPAAGARVERDVFAAATKIAWPMPPQPQVDGRFIRWREYRSVVAWRDEEVTLLREVGGWRRVYEAILSCRLQEQVDTLTGELLTAVKLTTIPDEVEEKDAEPD
jgi:hypothetical protein